MLFGQARRLCPNLQPITYDFEAYRSVSQLLYDTVARLVGRLVHKNMLFNIVRFYLRKFGCVRLEGGTFLKHCGSLGRLPCLIPQMTVSKNRSQVIRVSPLPESQSCE